MRLGLKELAPTRAWRPPSCVIRRATLAPRACARVETTLPTGTVT